MGLHQNIIRLEGVELNPFGAIEFQRSRKHWGQPQNLWPTEPVVYPNHLRMPPQWRTCNRQSITQFLPKLKGTHCPY